MVEWFKRRHNWENILDPKENLLDQIEHNHDRENYHTKNKIGLEHSNSFSSFTKFVICQEKNLVDSLGKIHLENELR